MDWNRFVFPAPKPTYSINLERLIAIPRSYEGYLHFEVSISNSLEEGTLQFDT